MMDRQEVLAVVIQERNELLTKVHELLTEVKSTTDAYSKYIEDTNYRILELEAVLANIRALCAQENHDGYPWDEIYKLTNEEE